MKLTIRDSSEEFIEVCRRCFLKHPEVTVECGDIFSRPAAYLVSPANSFGFMDGGIDLAYSKRFGWNLQADRLGSAPVMVGDSRVLDTGDDDFPHLVVLPTMLGPMDISQSTNVFLAFHRLVTYYREWRGEFVCPGLGAGVGNMPCERAAVQMEAAYSLATKPVAAVSSSAAHRYAETLTTVGTRTDPRDGWQVAGGNRG
jgi:O-acetyl-ADP-ribose deacetylase (regulator of RNase III)